MFIRVPLLFGGSSTSRLWADAGRTDTKRRTKYGAFANKIGECA